MRVLPCSLIADGCLWIADGRVPLYEYLEEADRNIFVCIMCETAELVENIEEICAVDGLDSLCIGAMDLSGSLGVPYGAWK